MNRAKFRLRFWLAMMDVATFGCRYPLTGIRRRLYFWATGHAYEAEMAPDGSRVSR
jgi:hypothetical protein